MKTIIKRGSRGDVVLFVQERLNASVLGVNLELDGIYGRATEDAVRAFQRLHNIVIDGEVGIRTLRALSWADGSDTESIKRVSKFLSENDLKQGAEDLGIELAVMKAVSEVESLGSGFIGDKCKILYEGHIFWKCLKNAGKNPRGLQTDQNRDILFPRWSDRPGYLGGLKEYYRLDRAKIIDESCAIQACSWGRYQILGMHYKDLGYTGTDDWEKRMQASEAEHFEAFKRFVINKNLVKYLKNKDFVMFEKRYNGGGQNGKYARLMLKAYNKHRRSQSD